MILVPECRRDQGSSFYKMPNQMIYDIKMVIDSQKIIKTSTLTVITMKVNISTFEENNFYYY